jgi:MoaA/NifB/PqqE/SkfB family radical SAM enzyme
VTYIDPRGKLFSHLDRLTAWQRGEKPAPVTLEWDLSNACTLGCVDCHFAYTHVKGPWAVTQRVFPVNQDKGGIYADANLVKRALREVNAAGVQGVVWTGGGEPTTHPQWVGILQEAWSLGIEQGMYTHGGLLTAETAGHLAKCCAWVVVSLDCLDGASYQREKRVPASRFTAACNGITWMAGSTVVGVSFLLHGQNWTQAREMVQLARSLGATYTTFRPAVQTQPDQPGVVLGDRSWILSALPLLEELSHEPDVEVSADRFAQYQAWTSHGYDTCYGIRLNATITPDGRVWVCPNRREFPDSCLGDLKTQTFGEIWATHPGQWTDFANCRAMCRLHSVNEQMVTIYRSREHAAFI